MRSLDSGCNGEKFQFVDAKRNFYQPTSGPDLNVLALSRSAPVEDT